MTQTELQEAPLLPLCDCDVANNDKCFWMNLKEAVCQLVEEIMVPLTISAVGLCLINCNIVSLRG